MFPSAAPTVPAQGIMPAAWAPALSLAISMKARNFDAIEARRG